MRTLLKYIICVLMILSSACTFCPQLNKQGFNDLGKRGGIFVAYSGNKNGYAYFRWNEPYIPKLHQECRKILLTDVRMLRGWKKKLEFSYSGKNSDWIPAHHISDVILSPNELNVILQRKEKQKGP